MRVIFPLLFLTLVLSPITTLAAPSTTTKMESTPLDGEDDAVLAHINRSDFAPRIESLLNISIGYQSGNYLEREQWVQGPYLLVRYASLKEAPLPAWDYEISLNSEDFFALAVGRRWYFAPDDKFRPYARLSGHTYLQTSDNFAGLAEIRRWRVHASIGAGERFTGEIGTGFSITGPDLFGQFGYNFEF